MSRASLPTASTEPDTVLKAMSEGSESTTPCPRANTQVFVVPRSIARSVPKRAMVMDGWTLPWQGAFRLLTAQNPSDPAEPIVVHYIKERVHTIVSRADQCC